jgi:AcrR family transcriptional regulator
MPPKPDQHLEQRILNAALRLCRTRGERGLTLRAVARAAGTTTPTVYKRFRSKGDLRVALGRHIRQMLLDQLLTSARVEDIYREYLHFAEAHPEEYRLLTAVWAEVFATEFDRPGEAWALGQFAVRFGGKPEDYAAVYNAIYYMSHGAASLINLAVEEGVRKQLHRNCVAACDALVDNVGILRAAGESEILAPPAVN